MILHLQCSVQSFGDLGGWCAIKNRNEITCNRVGKQRISSNVPRKLRVPHIRVLCTYVVRMRSLVNKRIEKPGCKKNQYRDDWSHPARIVFSCCRHGGLCAPSLANQLAVKSRGGKYVKDVPARVMRGLCHQRETGSRLTRVMIEDSLRPIWPQNKVITKQNIDVCTE